MKVCANCFDDIELNKYITENSTGIGKCKYCGKENSALIDAEELLDFFTDVFGLFKKDNTGNSLQVILQEDWKLFSKDVDSDRLLLDILNKTNVGIENINEPVLYSDEIVENTEYWELLKYDLKCKRRYLPDQEKLEEYRWDSFFNEQEILVSGTKLFRARVHAKDGTSIEPKDMYCPPQKFATAGRANPVGIPFLYLCMDMETPLYEVRASFLDELTIGQFEVKAGETLDLVDFTQEVSLFRSYGKSGSERDLIEYVKEEILKKHISFDLSKPMRRYDSELDYIPTQFICEFIKVQTGADGILFRSSVRKGGKNIVLFKEDKVECVEVYEHVVDSVAMVSSER